MPNQLSPQVLSQLFAQESSDPFLTLVTISHPDFTDDIRLVNNTEDIVSRTLVFMAFPLTLNLPVDDGETTREVGLTFDNVSLDFLGQLRSVTTDVKVKFEFILASLPDDVQVVIDGMIFTSMQYNSTQVQCKLSFDDFLNTALTAESYTPKNFPGIF